MIATLAGPRAGLDAHFCLLVTWTLVHFVWQGCLLALALAVAGRALRGASANLRYSAGLATLAAMAVCLPLTLALIDPAPHPLGANAVRLDPAEAMLLSADPLGWEPATPGSPVERPIEPAPAGDSLAPQHGWQVACDRVSSWALASLSGASTYATAAYAVGLAAMLARVVLGLAIGRRLRRQAIEISVGPTFEFVRRQAERLALRAIPSIAWCGRVAVPVVVGIVRPMILLPAALASGLTERQLELVLLHELAHIRRYDPIVNLLQRFVEAIGFFHPAVWWVSRQVSLERELACDDAVLRAGCQGPVYADALVRVAELCAALVHGEILAAGSLAAIGRGKQQLRRRIMRLVDADRPAAIRPQAPAAAIAVLLSAGMLLALAAWRSPALAEDTKTPGAAKEKTATPAAAEVADESSAESSAGAKPAGEPKPAAAAVRVLHFPADRSLGLLFVREAKDDFLPPIAHRPLGPAQGDVPVPAGVDVRLRVSDAASADLAWLDRLAPDDLQMLDLGDSQLDDAGLAHVTRLTGLGWLDLRSTAITDAGIERLVGLERLQVLGLDHCQGIVLDRSMEALSRLSQLRSIGLRGVNITNAGLAALCRLKHLNALWLEGNSVTDAGLAGLANLPALERLGLEDHKGQSAVTDAGLIHIGKLKNLRELHLSAQEVSDEGVARLKDLTRLELLALSNTQVSPAGLAALEPLQSLEWLSLSHQLWLDDADVAELVKLKSLRHIDAELQVSEKGLALLATLPQLGDLHLHDQTLSDAAIDEIAKMTSLRSLGFHRCPIGASQLKRLAGLPNLENLGLIETGLTGRELGVLAAAPKLASLSYQLEERTAQSSIQAIGKIQQLSRLNLSGSASSYDLAPLASLKNLESLVCWFLPVDNLGAEMIGRLRSLKRLSIAQSSITDSGLKRLAHLNQLELLTINGVFTDRGLESLYRLQSLAELDATSPYLSDAPRAGLEAALPLLARLRLKNNDPLQDNQHRQRASLSPTDVPARPRVGNEPANPLGGKNVVEIRIVSRFSAEHALGNFVESDRPVHEDEIAHLVRQLAASKPFRDLAPTVDEVVAGVRMTFEVMVLPHGLGVNYLGNFKTTGRPSSEAKPVQPPPTSEGEKPLNSADRIWNRLGLRLEPIPSTQPGQQKSKYRGGLTVVAVRPGSPAAGSRIVVGDILVGLHVYETVKLEDVVFALSRITGDVERVKFYILRDGESRFGNLTGPGLSHKSAGDDAEAGESTTEVARPQDEAKPASPPAPEQKTEDSSAADSLAGQNIVEIRVTGNVQRSSEQILAAISSRVDRPLDSAMLEKDVRTLAAKKWFLDVQPKIEPVDGGVRVTLQVVERPTLLYIKYLGNTKIRDKRLAKEIGLMKGSSLDPAAVEEGRQKIEEYYRSLGFKDVNVSILEGTNTGDRGVIFQIAEGEGQKSEGPKFVGNTIATGQRLKTQIQSRPAATESEGDVVEFEIVSDKHSIRFKRFEVASSLGQLMLDGSQDQEKIDQDIEKLTQHYRNLGFFRTKISREVVMDEKWKRPSVTYVINEGSRYRVAAIRFAGNSQFSSDQLADGSAQKVGQFYLRRDLDGEQAKLKRLYRQAGYTSATIEPELEFDEDAATVTIVYRIVEGEKSEGAEQEPGL